MAECLVAYDDAAYAAYEDLKSCRGCSVPDSRSMSSRFQTWVSVPDHLVSRYQGAIMVTFTERLNC